MFDHNSRYAKLTIKSRIEPDGREVKYVARRFLPPPERLQRLTEVRVTQGDRPDLVAAKTLGDPLAYWRIADANRAMNPIELTDELGVLLVIPLPDF